MSNNLIELKNISKSYGNQEILHDIDLNIKENEFLTLLGPSGSGKTTTLRIIAGFETATSGTIDFNGVDMLALAPNKREVNTVFQNYALFPHMNVFQNIAFGLKIKKLPKSEIEQKVGRMLKLVNLSGYEKRRIQSLSGGQQQRIAIARALVNEPKVLLLDEPLGALDLKLRKAMQIELKNMQKELGITFIYVTHDQEEALTMSDQIAVMNQGAIIQKGTPEEIYNEPKNKFVANFIGTSNIIDGVMYEDKKVRFFDTEFSCIDKKIASNVEVVVRPEDIQIENDYRSHNSFIGTVTESIFFGVHYETKVRVKDVLWKIHSLNKYELNQKLHLYVPENAIHVMEKNI